MRAAVIRNCSVQPGVNTEGPCNQYAHTSGYVQIQFIYEIADRVRPPDRTTLNRASCCPVNCEIKAGGGETDT